MHCRLLLGTLVIVSASGCGLFGSGGTVSTQTATAGNTTENTSANPPPPASAPPPATSNAPAAAPAAEAGDPALAGLTIRQREYAERQNADFQRAVDLYVRDCGPLNASIQWQSFAAQVDRRLDGEINVSVSGYCSQPLQTASLMCRDNSTTASTLQSRLQSYSCSYGNGQERVARIEGSALQYFVSWESTNDGEYVRDFLGRSL